jgi:hypothetical protein
MKKTLQLDFSNKFAYFAAATLDERKIITDSGKEYVTRL